MKKIIVIILAAMIFCGAICTYASQETGSDTYTEEKSMSAEENIASQNVFSTVYGFVTENSDKLLSVLSLAISIALTFMYKKGLVPILSESLGSIKNGVEMIDGSAKKIGEESSSSIAKTNEAIEKLERLSESVSDRVSLLEDFARNLEKSKEGELRLEEILLSQIEMLYSVFMSSSLPQYAKDRVGERVAEMKKLIGKEQEENA